MRPVEEYSFKLRATRSAGEVEACLLRPPGAHSLLVCGHGAGAGMRHAFMESNAHALAARGIATLRYQFPYIEQGRRAPDPAPVLKETVRSAVAAEIDTPSAVSRVE